MRMSNLQNIFLLCRRKTRARVIHADFTVFRENSIGLIIFLYEYPCTIGLDILQKDFIRRLTA